jgi:cell division protease FtsH
MIGSLGMAGSLFSYEAMRIPNTDIVTRVVSSDDGKASIERKLDTARSEVRVMLAEHRVVVEALRDALLDCHELIGDEILDVILRAGR